MDWAYYKINSNYLTKHFTAMTPKSISDISKSIFGLTKNNNGFFKSEKQAQFLIDQMTAVDGCFAHANSGFHSCPIFAKWDDKGIIKIVKATKKGDVIMFERKEKGVLTSIEIENTKRIERKIKSLEREISERKSAFENGSYNGTGDVNTYSHNMIERYHYFLNKKITELRNLQAEL